MQISTTLGMLKHQRTLFSFSSEPISNEVVIELLQKARETRQFSYAPYSNYNVGCAVLMKNGVTRRMFQGANIENAAYSPTMCAERSAIFSAVCTGYRTLLAVAVVGDINDQSLVSPCGVCRQVMVEFGDPETLIIMAKNDDAIELRNLKHLLPEAFGPANLGMRSQDYRAKM